jgi:hypothetical protein
MIELSDIFKTANARKVWKLLRDSEVPIISEAEYKNIDSTVVATTKTIVNTILRYPYAAPRAQFLRLLRRSSKNLTKIGISLKAQKAYVARIKEENGGSEIIRDICAPRTALFLEGVAPKKSAKKP